MGKGVQAHWRRLPWAHEKKAHYAFSWEANRSHSAVSNLAELKQCCFGGLCKAWLFRCLSLSSHACLSTVEKCFNTFSTLDSSWQFIWRDGGSGCFWMHTFQYTLYYEHVKWLPHYKLVVGQTDRQTENLPHSACILWHKEVTRAMVLYGYSHWTWILNYDSRSCRFLVIAIIVLWLNLPKQTCHSHPVGTAHY